MYALSRPLRARASLSFSRCAFIVRLHISMHVDICAGIRTGKCAGMCIDMRVGMCTDASLVSLLCGAIVRLHIDAYVNMHGPVYRQVHANGHGTWNGMYTATSF